MLTKPYKYKQNTVATSPSTANSNTNDSVAKLELALAHDIKPGPPGTSVVDPVLIMKHPPILNLLAKGGSLGGLISGVRVIYCICVHI